MPTAVPPVVPVRPIKFHLGGVALDFAATAGNSVACGALHVVPVAAVLDDPVYSAALSKRGSRRSRTLSWDRTAANLLHALRATAELD